MAYTQQTPIGTPDVNLITKTLAGLQPDSALQQYAMLHKNNPYILSLAKSESDRRKQLRTAAQGNPVQQPTVVDQNIAGMAQQQLPENQGIAQIPTPNMQRMADGGIAGYEDDEEGMATGGMGGMFNFAQQSEPVVRMSGGGHIPRYQGIPKPSGDGSVVSSNPMYNVPGFQAVQPRDTFTQAGSPENMTPWERFSSYMGEKKKQATLLEIAYRIQTGIATPDEIVLYNSAKITGGDKAATDVKYPPQDAIRTKDFPGVKPGFEKMPVDAAAPPPSSGNKPPAPFAEKQGLATLAPSKAMTADEAKTQAGDFVDYEGAFTALRKAESDQESQGARLRTMLADSLPKTPALQGLEKLLDKQDAATGGEKDKAAGLALLSAGLAIAGGSSPFALQNLKEAIPAVTQYGEALKDIKKMERENMKMRGDIEQARRAEGRDDTKLKLQLEEKIGERKDNINKLGIDLTAKIAGTTADVASKLWSTSFEAQNRKEIALFEGQNRKDVAGMQVNAQANAELNKYERLGAADPNSALAKGFQMFKQEAAEPRLYGEYIKLTQDPMNGAAFLQKYPTFAVYKEGYTGGGLQFAPPPDNASILKPPKG
jgi:hypothetical protein